jgi:hypothetical protein
MKIEKRGFSLSQKGDNPMRGILSIITVIFLAGCVTSPQTRDELKTTMINHPSLAIVGTYTTNRRFEEVVATLDRKWQECYGIRKTTTRTEGGMTTMSYRDTFHPQSRKVNNSLVEMTLQMTTEGMIMLSKVPPGGDYIVALDLQRLSGNKTKLMWYSSAWGWTEAWERNKQWSDGKNMACDS